MVATGGQVETGMPLVRLEAVDEDDQGAAAAGARKRSLSTCLSGSRPVRRAAGPPAPWRTCAACSSASTAVLADA